MIFKKKYLKSEEEFKHLVFDRISDSMKEAGKKVGGPLQYDFTANEDLLKFIKYFGYLSKDQILLRFYDDASDDFSEIEISKNLFYEIDKDKYYFEWVGKPALRKII